MTFLSPALLGPIRRQKYRLKGLGPVSVPRPRDSPTVHASGLDPDRVLVFGNGMAVGWGVSTHELALPGQLARALSARTGRGSDVDLVASPDWNVETAGRSLLGVELHVYDAVVIVIGASDAFRFLPEKRWLSSLGRILDSVQELAGEATEVTLVGIQPISTVPFFSSKPGGAEDQWAIRLNDLSRALIDKRPGTRFVEPPAAVGPRPGQVGPSPDDHRYRSPERFFEWAACISAHIAPSLGTQGAARRVARSARDAPQPGERRHAVVGELGLLDAPREKRFDEIVRRAQQIFGTAGAAFSVIDDDRQWNKSIVGYDISEVPIEESFCATTIRHARPLVVGDARADERFSGMRSLLRFYAGYPVEAVDGTRIGALCVFDERPRDADVIDLALLRDCALAIQRELADGLPE